MSRQMNLPQIQRILQEFERESSMMDMKEEMMGESIDDAMEDDVGETEEEEGDRILEEVLAEIGVSVGQQVRSPLFLLLLLRTSRCMYVLMHIHACGMRYGAHSQLGEAPTSMPASKVSEPGVRRAVAIGESSGPGGGGSAAADASSTGGGGGDAAGGGIDDLQARLDNLRRD